MGMRNDDRGRSKDSPLHEAVAGDARQGVLPDAPELERYELFEGPRYRFELDRRGFVKTFGAGLLVLVVAARASKRGDAQESGRGFGGGDRMPSDVGAWLHIAENGAITVFTGKTEIGQNIRTSLTQAVAEELGAPIGSITLVMRSEEHTSELQSLRHLVCRLLLEKKK